jgi:hypothetical protein
MLGKRKRAHALIAQSMYEPLDAGDRAELETLLRSMPDLENEAQALRTLVDRIPTDVPAFDGDLRPIVMANLDRAPRRAWPVLPHWAIALLAFVVVASGVAYRIVINPPHAVAPGPVADAGDASGVAAALADADALLASRDPATAYARLAAAVDARPRDPDAALACQRMADIAFDELKWYPEAFAGYDALRHDYVEQFRAVPANFARLNLLDESRGVGDEYASLRALDRAAGDFDFGSLSNIVARRPATYLAASAASEMARIAAHDAGVTAAYDPVSAMRMASERATDPVVKLQLRLEIAHLLAATPDGRVGAREIYQDIASGDITTLAEAARKSLESIEAGAATGEQL